MDNGKTHNSQLLMELAIIIGKVITFIALMIVVDRRSGTLDTVKNRQHRIA